MLGWLCCVFITSIKGLSSFARAINMTISVRLISVRVKRSRLVGKSYSYKVVLRNLLRDGGKTYV